MLMRRILCRTLGNLVLERMPLSCGLLTTMRRVMGERKEERLPSPSSNS